MTREEIRVCSLTFGNCWINPPKNIRTENKEKSIKPNGTQARDGLNYGIN